MKSIMKRGFKVLLAVLVAGAGVLFLGLKKHIRLDTMQRYETDHFVVYYEVLDLASLQDLGEKLEA